MNPVQEATFALNNTSARGERSHEKALAMRWSSIAALSTSGDCGLRGAGQRETCRAEKGMKWRAKKHLVELCCED